MRIRLSLLCVLLVAVSARADDEKAVSEKLKPFSGFAARNQEIGLFVFIGSDKFTDKDFALLAPLFREGPRFFYHVHSYHPADVPAAEKFTVYASEDLQTWIPAGSVSASEPARSDEQWLYFEFPYVAADQPRMFFRVGASNPFGEVQ